MKDPASNACLFSFTCEAVVVFEVTVLILELGSVELSFVELGFVELGFVELGFVELNLEELDVYDETDVSKELGVLSEIIVTFVVTIEELSGSGACDENDEFCCELVVGIEGRDVSPVFEDSVVSWDDGADVEMLGWCGVGSVSIDVFAGFNEVVMTVVFPALVGTALKYKGYKYNMTVKISKGE
jgi:hypothetical protein